MDTGVSSIETLYFDWSFIGGIKSTMEKKDLHYRSNTSFSRLFVLYFNFVLSFKSFYVTKFPFYNRDTKCYWSKGRTEQIMSDGQARVQRESRRFRRVLNRRLFLSWRGNKYINKNK